MTVQTTNTTMLYCPKCQQTYEEGSQRFCSNEGERLLNSPASGEKSSKFTEGVFTSILNRKTDKADDKFSNPPRFPKAQPTKFSPPSFRPPIDSKIFSAGEDDSLLEIDLPISKPKSAFVKADDVPVIQPRSRNNQAKEIDLTELVQNVPTNLIGQIVGGRYTIIEQIEQGENGTSLLAEDNLIADRRVVVKILSGDEPQDSFVDRIYAEERTALREISHPNVASVIDDGKFDGKTYIVTERIEGKSVKDYLQKNGQFNALRAARIVSQTADALGAIHQSGILHRNLRPENIILTVDADGKEQIKLTNFGESGDKLNKANLLYKSPEQVEGKVANFTSDGFSLAVVAYQMLTNRLPFNAVSVGDLLKAQREGLKIYPTSLRTDLTQPVDRILEKALAFNPFDRYEKVSDFGEEFFNAATSGLSQAAEEIEPAKAEDVVTSESPIETEKPVVEFAPISPEVEAAEEIHAKEDEDLIRSVKATEDLAWEKRSPLPLDKANPGRSMLSLIGVAVLLATLLGIWYYFINRSNENDFVQTQIETANQNDAPLESPFPANVAPTPEVIEAPPLQRAITQPPDTVYFQNSKENLKGDAMKNFLGFSLYYPKDWKINAIADDNQEGKARTKFLDVSKNASSGTPIEQMLVGYYNSRGTFKTDMEVFPSLVRETNQTLRKIIPNYQIISEGKKTINNGWQAYEVTFQGTGRTANGENVTLWGKRLFVPTAMRGMKNGYVITMLATSLSSEVKNAEDVGVKGELATVLETFEPNQNF